MSGRLRIRQVLVVEGRYDAAALANAVDTLILTTDGFSIFKDRQAQELLRDLGRRRGVMVLTDPDAAGFRIRRFVSDIVGPEHVCHAYVPAIPGKEGRKPRPGKEGLLGVEGFDAASLQKAVLTAGAQQSPPRAGRAITPADLYAWGLSGTAGSREARYAFLQRLGLPPRLSKNALCQVLNSLYTWQEVDAMLRTPDGGERASVLT